MTKAKCLNLVEFNPKLVDNNKMGSIDAACIAGFLCRLCSEMHRTVIHIYGDQGQKHDLAGKINAYLPVTVSFLYYSLRIPIHWSVHSIDTIDRTLFF